ncbi:MAG: FeoA family protein [Candidatus Njordarchaeia archaeon]
MNLMDAKPGSAAVFIGFNGSDEEFDEIMKMGFSVGVMVIIQEITQDSVKVKFEDGREIKIPRDMAEKIVVNEV